MEIFILSMKYLFSLIFPECYHLHFHYDRTDILKNVKLILKIIV